MGTKWGAGTHRPRHPLACDPVQLRDGFDVFCAAQRRRVDHFLLSMQGRWRRRQNDSRCQATLQWEIRGRVAGYAGLFPTRLREHE